MVEKLPGFFDKNVLDAPEIDLVLSIFEVFCSESVFGKKKVIFFLAKSIVTRRSLPFFYASRIEKCTRKQGFDN